MWLLLLLHIWKKTTEKETLTNNYTQITINLIKRWISTCKAFDVTDSSHKDLINI